MREILLPIFPNKLHHKKDEIDQNDIVSIYLNLKDNSLFLKRRNNNLLFDKDYNPSQSASHYYQAHLSNTANKLKNFFEERKYLKCKSVDVGCGQGEFVNLLNKDNFFNSIGFDTSYLGNDLKIKKRYLNKNDYDPEVNLITLKYVLDYIYPPNELLYLLKNLFPNAFIYIEGSYIEDTIKNNRFYDICYEQINYFSKKSYVNFFDGKILKNGKSFGDQYQYIISHVKDLNPNLSDEYKNQNLELTDLNNLFPNMTNSLEKIKELIKLPGKIWFWGAARKSVMFLHHLFNFTEINKYSYRFGCVDQDILKHEKYLPSTKLEVISPDNFLQQIKKEDKVIVSNPVYFNEIKNSLSLKLSFNPTILHL